MGRLPRHLPSSDGHLIRHPRSLTNLVDRWIRAKEALRALVAGDESALEDKRSERTIGSLAFETLEREYAAWLAADEPSEDADRRVVAMTGVLLELLPGDRRIADLARRTLGPRRLEIERRDIRRGHFPTVNSPIVPLHSGEAAEFQCHAGLLEPARVRGTKGSFASARVRVTNDVSVRVGGFGSESSLKRVEMRATDAGTLLLTTERVLYIGAAQTVEFARAAVLTAVTGTPELFGQRSVTFHFESSRNPVGFRMDSGDAAILDAILNWKPPATQHPVAGGSSSPFTPDAELLGPLPPRNEWGWELPTSDVLAEGSIGSLRAFFDQVPFSSRGLTFALGSSESGTPVGVELAKTHNLLVAGIRSSARHRLLNALIGSLLCRASPMYFQMLLVDRPGGDFAEYNGLPHLLCPTITTRVQASAALHKMASEVDFRYERIKKADAADIDALNAQLPHQSRRRTPYP